MNKQSSTNWLEQSLTNQKTAFNDSLILNPTENIMLSNISNEDVRFMHGLYVSDQDRDNIDHNELKVSFGGRSQASSDNRKINKEWASALKGEDSSLRLLSGLHAHTVIFMSLGKIGETVLLLPEKGGGHFSTKKILLRLGFKIIEIPLCNKNMSIDILETIDILNSNKIDYLFIDRSEGIYYEDFTELVTQCKKKNIYTVFDASQYLTNILCGHFKNPFEMGFDLILSTLHKNFPGPQKAMVVTNRIDTEWEKIKKNFSVYISNSHPMAIYQAADILQNMDVLNKYSSIMLESKKELEKHLKKENVPILSTPKNEVPTHHIWITFKSADKAYSYYKTLEQLRIMTNFRLLPYDLGHGIRAGVSAAVIQGLQIKDIPTLSSYMAAALFDGFSIELQLSLKKFIKRIKKNALH